MHNLQLGGLQHRFNLVHNLLLLHIILFYSLSHTETIKKERKRKTQTLSKINK